MGDVLNRTPELAWPIRDPAPAHCVAMRAISVGALFQASRGPLRGTGNLRTQAPTGGAPPLEKCRNFAWKLQPRSHSAASILEKFVWRGVLQGGQQRHR